MKTNDEKKDINLNPNIKHTNEKKSQKAENKNTKCTKQKCKQLFIMIKYKNINTERNKQSYGT
jgi:hypothetical protein